LGVWNELIQYTLFLMGKFNSKVEQLKSRSVSWNGLCSKFEVPLYLVQAMKVYGGNETLTPLILISIINRIRVQRPFPAALLPVKECPESIE
jgi:hypothetical protein